jgi:hypothetical protein
MNVGFRPIATEIRGTLPPVPSKSQTRQRAKAVAISRKRGKGDAWRSSAGKGNSYMGRWKAACATPKMSADDQAEKALLHLHSCVQG